MTCPSKEDLFSCVNNEGSPEARKTLLAHVESCPMCAEELAFLAAVANHVRSAAPPGLSECPSEETLCAYADGAMTRDQEVQLTRHLLVCETCRRQTVDIRLATTQTLPDETPARAISATRRFIRIALPMAAAAAILLAVGFSILPLRRQKTSTPGNMPSVSYVTLFRGEAIDLGNGMFEGPPKTWRWDKVLTDDVLGLLRKVALDEAETASLLKGLKIPQLRGIPPDVAVIKVDKCLQTSASTGQSIRVVVEKHLGIYVVRIRSHG